MLCRHREQIRRSLEPEMDIYQFRKKIETSFQRLIVGLQCRQVTRIFVYAVAQRQLTPETNMATFQLTIIICDFGWCLATTLMITINLSTLKTLIAFGMVFLSVFKAEKHPVPHIYNSGISRRRPISGLSQIYRSGQNFDSVTVQCFTWLHVWN